METITWQEFEKVELLAGTIVQIEDFPKARKPAYKIWVDLGDEIGVKRSSAQVTSLYTKEELLGTQVVCVANFPTKQIADFISEVLVTGFALPSGEIVLSRPERPVQNGTKIS